LTPFTITNSYRGPPPSCSQTDFVASFFISPHTTANTAKMENPYLHRHHWSDLQTGNRSRYGPNSPLNFFIVGPNYMTDFK